ncbi:YigZ family protein [Spirochaetia bacterium 38H-sp]|uniref:YigZ family protein n=1 Tax=Rarispira pelagica TaxID=3141764 RepID=A0ABU9UDP6_9SPIR
MSSYFMISSVSMAEYTVKRSRFISYAIPVIDRDTAEIEIKKKREEYSDATHVVYAYAIGKPGSEIIGMSDDGEPHGTAGKPVLSQITGRNLWNLLVVVIRYFGGIKLGTGGLVHAYAEAARLALDSSDIREYVPMCEFSLSCSYELYHRIKPLVDKYSLKIKNENYASSVELDASIAETKWHNFKTELMKLSQGGKNLVLKFNGGNNEC